MDQPRELVSRLADHVTAMASIVTYEDAAAASAQSLIDFLPVDTVAQIRLQTDGAIVVGETRGPLSEVLAGLPFERLFEMPHLPVPGAVWQRHVSENSPAGTFERTLADAGAQTVIVSGLNGNGRLRGLLVLTSRERVALTAEDQRVLELLGSLTVSVLRSTLLVASLRRNAVTDPLTGLVAPRRVQRGDDRPPRVRPPRADPRRHRPLQAVQRHQGPRRGRPRAPGRRQRDVERAAHHRLGVPDRRRRVRGDRRGPRRGRGARHGRADAQRGGGQRRGRHDLGRRRARRSRARTRSRCATAPTRSCTGSRPRGATAWRSIAVVPARPPFTWPPDV